MHAPGREAMLQRIASEALATAGYTGRKGFSGAAHGGALARASSSLRTGLPGGARLYELRARHRSWPNDLSTCYIVALMTEVLDLEPDAGGARGIGTGSGYQQQPVLAELASYALSIELIPELATRRSSRDGYMQHLGYRNVEVRTADGYGGWPEHAPYERHWWLRWSQSSPGSDRAAQAGMAGSYLSVPRRPDRRSP